MSNYFRQVPDFEYVSRLPDAKISDYITVKNLFKKNELRPDIFNDATVFTEYKIKGDDRPDNVAIELYEDSSLDWLVLLCNNIINVQTEWPLTQESFENYLFEKYGNEQNIHGTHHYESKQIKNSLGSIVLPEGLQVPQYFSMKFFDVNLGTYTEIGGVTDPITTEVTNYEYEINLQNERRHIYILKQDYLNIILTDMDRIMPYKTGSTQYVSETLVRGENIRLYS